MLYKLFFVLLISFLFLNSSLAQWSGKPEEPRELVQDVRDASELSVAKDGSGGIFFIWQDSKESANKNLWFLHAKKSGELSFRADGKSVSADENSVKLNSILVPSVIPGVAMIAWEQKNQAESFVYTQVVKENGQRIFDERGLMVLRSSDDINQIHASYGKSAIGHVAAIEKTFGTPTLYNVKYQKIFPTGKLRFTQAGLQVSSSYNAKQFPKIITDGNGGAFIFWMEFEKMNSRIYMAHIDSSAGETTKIEPVLITDSKAIIQEYDITPFAGGSLIYINWQLSGKNKELYHQIVDNKGKARMAYPGVKAVTLPGDNTNPRAIAGGDSTIILSWINNFSGSRDIYAQKLSQFGNPRWSGNGVVVADFEGDQLGAELCPDGRGGAIIGWIDNRSKSAWNIYAQRISSKGDLMWDDEGIPVSTSNRSIKNYLYMVSDLSQGAIAVFRESKEGNKSGIFGQRIRGNNTYASEVSEFAAIQSGEEVKLYWQVNNESAIKGYKLEVFSGKRASDSLWTEIEWISVSKEARGIYETYHEPDSSGMFYYRLSQFDKSDRVSHVEITKLNFIKSDNVNKPFIGQNIPNPFSESTVISYSIPAAGKIRFEFFNSKFNLIKDETVTQAKAGKYQYTFSAAGLEPGVYFYRVTLGDVVEVKKMVLTAKEKK